MALLPETLGPTGRLAHVTQSHRKLNSGWRDVKADFGAVGDGVTDDTAAVQAALNAGGVTYFPVGTYLTGRLTIPHAAVMQGVNSGTYNNTFTDAQVSRIKLKAGSNDHLIYIPTTSNRTLMYDLELDGNKGNQAGGVGHVVLFVADTIQNEAQAVFERVYVHDGVQSGIRIDGWRQAVHLNDVVSNFNGEHGIQIIGTDCVIDKPIIGDNTGSGIVVSGNVTVVRAGAIYNNAVGINVTPGTRRVSLIGNGVDKNLQTGIVVANDCAGVNIVGSKMTSNGRQTNNTYPHIDIQTTTGQVAIIGTAFSGLEPGVTNATDYAIKLGAGASAYESGNMYEGGSVGGYTNDSNRMYTSTRPTFREASSLWISDASAAVAEQGLNLPAANTELDVTFGGTRRTFTQDVAGREVQMTVRGRKVASAATQTLTFSVRNAANSTQELCSVTTAALNAVANFEALPTGWTPVPAWFSALSTATLAVYVSGGNGTDDYVFRDVTLRWRG